MSNGQDKKKKGEYCGENNMTIIMIVKRRNFTRVLLVYRMSDRMKF